MEVGLMSISCKSSGVTAWKQQHGSPVNIQSVNGNIILILSASFWRPPTIFTSWFKILINFFILEFRSVQLLSRVWLFETPWTSAHQASCPSPTPGVYPNSCPSSQWCHPAISSSVAPFSFCPQSFPASGSFPMSQLFTSGGQSIGVSTSVLPMNTQDWSPLGWTGWISLQSKGFSRVFSNTTIQKHQFFGTQLSSQSNSHIYTWLLEKP